MEPKKLLRSQRNKMFLGVCGGLGNYFNVDATVFRILFVIFGLTFIGLIAYIAAGVIMPIDTTEY